MSDDAPNVTADRKLFSVHRVTVSVLIAVAAVMTLLWIIDTWSAAEIPEDDVTWFVSVGIRLVTFIGMTLLSFLATYRAQPVRVTPSATARPTASSLRLRIVAAACGALFFGDLAASSFAERDGSWVTTTQTVALGLFVLAAVIAVATGRATLRLWREAGGEMPLWREPTEAVVNRLIPSVSSQTVWLGVFLVAWLLANDLSPIFPLSVQADAVTVTLMLEGVTLTLIGVAHYVNRELVLRQQPYDRRARWLDVAMAVLGTGMSTEVGIRAIAAYDQVPVIGFWLGAAICLLGLIAGAARFLRAVQAPERRSD
jgi:hypothetical protein